MIGIVAGISSALLGTFISYYHNYYLYRGIPFQKGSQFETYFSQDYYEARDKFCDAVAQHPKMKLHSLKLDVEEGREGDGDLTIDIGLLPRSPNKVLIHISGTHGVEGFVGSAIQTSLLLDDTNTMKAHFNLDVGNKDEDESLPTIVFVHALNPYGFSKLRRVNENNVDLNRNFLRDDQFDEVRARDPNHVGYVDMMDFINPTEQDFFFPRAFHAIALNGFNKMKQCIVTGNYHFPKSLYYGGSELEKSHRLLKEFLSTHLDVENIKAVGILDVHSGLGRSGFDTIALTDVGLEESSQIFGGSEHLSILKDRDTDGSGALSGYDKVVGFATDGLADQVFSSSAKIYPVTQEFGTLPAILVFKATRDENVMYHYNPKNRHPKYSQALRDAFYFDENPEWKNKVISRGQEVFYQLYSHLASLK